MLVRSFHLSDYVAVTELFKHVLTEDCYEETMEALTRQLSWDSELVLVAIKNEQIVGVIIGTIDNYNGYY
jgi:predicted N-acetyltransferase YhbS